MRVVCADAGKSRFDRSVRKLGLISYAANYLREFWWKSSENGTRFMAVAFSEFRKRIVDSGMMTSAELDEVIDEFQGSGKSLDVYELAKQLVLQKKITEYQARAIYHGKGKALTLGKYVILSKVGEGGMGIVFQAEHRHLHRIVALKVLSSSRRNRQSFVRRFQREVRAAGLLEHPNIVTAYDADKVDGVEFLVMQYVNGTNLADLVKERGPLPVSMAISCIFQAARGLEYAHNRGVVHRDIKPSNLLLDRDGTLKILDMGLARLDPRLVDSTDPDLTDSGDVMGTADYMAPEQAACMRRSDRRSDIYSLGYTLWFLLTGRLAYLGEHRIERIVAHWDKPIPSLRDACPEVTPALESVFVKMVAKKPEDRYQTMTEVITDLERCRTSEAAAETHTPSSADDQELSSFLQALPELSLVRETKHTRRATTTGNGLFRRRNGRKRNDLTRAEQGHAPANRENTEYSGSVSGSDQRSSSWRVSGPAISVLLGILFASLLVVIGILNSGRLDSSDHRHSSERPDLTRTKGPPPPKVGQGWIALFDGKDLSKWEQIGSAKWTVESNRLVGTGQDGWLATLDCEYSDFEVSTSYKIHGGGDSGIFLRAWHEGEISQFLEVQLRDDVHPSQHTKSDANSHTGALVGIAAPSVPVDAGANSWHRVAIRASDRQIKVWIDDQLVNVSNLDKVGLQRPSVHTRNRGCIGLEAGSGTVEFRDFWVRRLDKNES